MKNRFWKRHFVYWGSLIIVFFLGIFASVTYHQLQKQEQRPYIAGIITDTRFSEYELSEGIKRKRMVRYRDFFFQLKDQPRRLLRLNQLSTSEWKAFEKEIKHRHAMRLQYEDVILDGETQYITAINAENEHWQLRDFSFRRKMFTWITVIAGVVVVWLLLLLRKDYKTIRAYVEIESVHRSHHTEAHNIGGRY